MVVDEQLIEACKQGEERAQRRLYEQYSSLMFGVCLRYCQNREEAEDLLQEGFLTIFSKVGQFSGKGSFVGWMRRVMVNTVLMSLRKKSEKRYFMEIGEINELKIVDQNKVEEVHDADPEDVKAMIEQADFGQEELLLAVSELPDGYKVVFNLAVVEGYKHREIAEMLEISESTSKSQLLRARKRLQELLYHKSLEKQKKSKRKLVYAFVLLGMNENFNYIDEILKKGFENLKVQPSTDWVAMSAKMQAAKGAAEGAAASTTAGTGQAVTQGASMVTKIASSVVSYVSTHVFTVVSFVAASVFCGGLITSSSTIEPQLENAIGFGEQSTIQAIEQQQATFIPTSNEIAAGRVQPHEQHSTVNQLAGSELESVPVGVGHKEATQTEETTLHSFDRQTEQTVYDTVKVPVNKTIYKTKTRVIVDTVRKTKPIIIAR